MINNDGIINGNDVMNMTILIWNQWWWCNDVMM